MTEKRKSASTDASLREVNVADVNQLVRLSDSDAIAKVVTDTLEVCLFSRVKDTNPQLALLGRIVEMVRDDAEVKRKTGRYRMALEDADEDTCKKIKDSMPGFGVASIFEGGRSVTRVKSLTGLTMADIDDVSPDRIEEMLALIKADAHTLLAYKTVSGKGIHVIAPYELQPAAQNITQAKAYYVEAFSVVNDYYARLVGIDETDEKCKDLARLSFLSYDPDVYYNPEAVPLTVEVKPTRPVGRPPKKKLASPKVKDVVPIVEQTLADKGLEYKKGSRHDYVCNLSFEMNKYGVSQTDCLEWVTTTYTDLPAYEVENTVRSCYSHTEQHGTKKLSGEERKRESATADVRDIRKYLEERCYRTRYDSIKRKYEVYDEDTDTWHELTEREENTLYQDITENIGKRISMSDLRIVIGSDYSEEYNALVNYVTSLEYDPDDRRDYIAELAARVNVGDEEKQKVFERFFKKWFVGMIAGWLNVGVGNHTILVLVGPQGIYKSNYFLHMLPPVLGEYKAEIRMAQGIDKDVKLQTAENGLVILDELDAMDDKTLNAFKAASVAKYIDERDVYAPRREKRRRIATFCATSNKFQLLTDTQNRRFLVFAAKSIVSPFDNPLPYEKIYAQAYHLLVNEGFQYWFDQAEMKEQAQHNADFAVPNIAEELIEMNFRVPSQEGGGEFYNTASILSAISYGYAGREHVGKRDIAPAMKKLGFVECRVNNKRGWRVVVITADEMRANRRLDANRSTPINE